MNCTNCGKEIASNAKFCPHCGNVMPLPTPDRANNQVPIAQAPLDPQGDLIFTAQPQEEASQAPIPVKKKKKGKVGLIITLIAILGLAITAGVLYLKWYNSPDQKAMRALAAGDYDAALDILEDNDEARDNEDLAETLKERIAGIEKDFLAGTTDYTTAKDTLDTIREMDISDISKELEATAALVETVNESRAHFDAAEEFMAAGKFEDAIAQYLLVAEEDPNYEKAASQRTAAEGSFREDALKRAAEYADVQEYSDAITILNGALSVLPNDAELTKQIEIYTSSRSDKEESDTLAEAKALADKGDYLGAMDLVNKLISSSGESATLKATYTTYYNKYIDQVLAEAEEKTAKNDFDGAILILNNGLKKAPGDEKLTARLSEIQSSKPVPITDLTPVNGDWKWNNGNPVDPFENDYSYACNYVIIDEEDLYTTAIEYRLYGKYSKMTLQIGPYTNIDQDGQACVKVYADDQLVYTSPTIVRKMDAFEAPVSVSGADYIKIEVIGVADKGADTYWPRNSVIISNVQLWPE